jgi:hypothetical protein
MSKRIACLIASLLLCSGAFAQINESDTLKFQLRASLTGNYQTGNITVLTLRGKLDVAWAPVKDWVFKSQNSSLYQEFYKKQADNDWFSRNYLYYRPQRKLYPYAIAYISTNFRRKIDMRYFAGAGLTWQVLRRSDHVVKLSANAVYEQTRFNSTIFNYTVYDGSNKIDLWRASAFIGGWDWLFHHRLRFYYDAYWQPSFDNSDNYRTQLDAGIDMPLWKGLAVTALYTYTHENVVAQQVKQTDNILTFGINYSFKARQ